MKGREEGKPRLGRQMGSKTWSPCLRGEDGMERAVRAGCAGSAFGESRGRRCRSGAHVEVSKDRGDPVSD